MGTATVTPHELLASESFEHNLLLRENLSSISKFLNSKGKKIVTTNGSFDLLHHGHIAFLKEARLQGDVLIVGLNSDSSIRKNKGPHRPLISQEHRAEMLLSLEFVDYVHIFNESTPIPFLNKIKPHIHVNGSEYGEDCIEADTVRKNNGQLYIIKIIKGFSTSALIKKISSLGLGKK